MTAGRMLLMEAIKEGYIEDYRAEIEFQYTVLFYINTLFSAMPRQQHVKGCYNFTRKLGREMKRTFPGFEKNVYYEKRINAEEKKLIHMQMRSHFCFFIYYRLLWFYRNLRKRFSNA
jgi:glycosyltransferase EpsH